MLQSHGQGSEWYYIVITELQPTLSSYFSLRGNDPDFSLENTSEGGKMTLTWQFPIWTRASTELEEKEEVTWKRWSRRRKVREWRCPRLVSLNIPRMNSLLSYSRSFIFSCSILHLNAAIGMNQSLFMNIVPNKAPKKYPVQQKAIWERQDDNEGEEREITCTRLLTGGRKRLRDKDN